MRVENRKYVGITPGSVYIGRPSPLGNPHRIGHCCNGWSHNRRQVIDLYRRWLFEQLKSDSPARRALSELNEDSVLACWCAPLACHGDVIIRAWYWAKLEGLI